MLPVRRRVRGAAKYWSHTWRSVIGLCRPESRYVCAQVRHTLGIFLLMQVVPCRKQTKKDVSHTKPRYVGFTGLYLTIRFTIIRNTIFGSIPTKSQ